MKAAAIFLLASTFALQAQSNRTVFVEDNSTRDAYGSRVALILRGGYTQADLVRKQLLKCSAVSVTPTEQGADFVVRLTKGGTTLTTGSGDLVYTTHSRNELTMGKDVCKFVTTLR